MEFLSEVPFKMEFLNSLDWQHLSHLKTCCNVNFQEPRRPMKSEPLEVASPPSDCEIGQTNALEKSQPADGNFLSIYILYTTSGISQIYLRH